MKPYIAELDITYIPEEKIKHPHRWEREERRIIKRSQKKRARRIAKEEIQEQIKNGNQD